MDMQLKYGLGEAERVSVSTPSWIPEFEFAAYIRCLSWRFQPSAWNWQVCAGLYPVVATLHLRLSELPGLDPQDMALLSLTDVDGMAALESQRLDAAAQALTDSPPLPGKLRNVLLFRLKSCKVL